MLHWTDVRIMSNEECRKNNTYYDSDREICAVNKNVGGCNGDSGSPLVYNKVIVGVLSYVRNLIFTCRQKIFCLNFLLYSGNWTLWFWNS